MADDFISKEDKELFRSQMKSVTPLNKPLKRASSPAKAAVVPVKKRREVEKPVDSINFLSDYIPEPVLSESVLSYALPSMPFMRLRSLKKGQIPWQGRLDLHGYTVEQARQALMQFIPNQVVQDKNCVLIIHGKGGHLGEAPVLKNMLNKWLPQFNEVLAYHSALPKDGGHGAVYVLLKR
jgi:DNA-nicking Smr family endonuclease